MTSNLSHPIPTGTNVLVHEIVLAQRPFLIAPARIVAPVANVPGVYRVRFEGERIDCVRVILDGPFQSHSAGCLSALHKQWLASFRHAQHLQAFLRSDDGGLL